MDLYPCAHSAVIEWCEWVVVPKATPKAEKVKVKENKPKMCFKDKTDKYIGSFFTCTLIFLRKEDFYLTKIQNGCIGNNSTPLWIVLIII